MKATIAEPRTESFSVTPPAAEAKAWPKCDPRLGLRLCKSCWNSVAIPWDGRGKRPQGRHNCELGSCECPCTDMKPPKRVKFVGEGQVSLALTTEGREAGWPRPYLGRLLCEACFNLSHPNCNKGQCNCACH